MRRKLVAGNWKMFGSLAQNEALLKAVAAGADAIGLRLRGHLALDFVGDFDVAHLQVVNGAAEALLFVLAEIALCLRQQRVQNLDRVARADVPVQGQFTQHGAGISERRVAEQHLAPRKAPEQARQPALGTQVFVWLLYVLPGAHCG